MGNLGNWTLTDHADHQMAEHGITDDELRTLLADPAGADEAPGSLHLGGYVIWWGHGLSAVVNPATRDVARVAYDAGDDDGDRDDTWDGRPRGDMSPLAGDLLAELEAISARHGDPAVNGAVTKRRGRRKAQRESAMKRWLRRVSASAMGS